jgi:hypothetical protein
MQTTKRVVRLCLVVGLFTFGIQARAAAAPILMMAQMCQGGTCDSVGPNVQTFIFSLPTVVGDYQIIFLNGAALESASQSSLETPFPRILVQRLTMNRVEPLVIWMSAMGYTELVGPSLNFLTTFEVDTSTANAGPAPVTFQGWYSPSNFPGILGMGAPPPDGITAGPIGCVVGGGTSGCSALPGSVTILPDGGPFSLTTLTTFNIPTAGPNQYFSSSRAIVTVADTTSVPEPASMLLLGASFAGVAVRRYRRQRS